MDKMHKLSQAVIKTDDNGNPVTAVQLGLTMRQTLDALRGGITHNRAGITKNKGGKRNKVRSKMARNSRRANRG